MPQGLLLRSKCSPAVRAGREPFRDWAGDACQPGPREGFEDGVVEQAQVDHAQHEEEEAQSFAKLKSVDLAALH